MDKQMTTLELLTQGVPAEHQQAVRAAYWMGCSEGMQVREEMTAVQRAVSHRDETGTVLYLKDRKA